MKKTKISELLGIDYPIIQGGMGWIADAELAAAVSNAGGLGMISPTAGAKEGENWPENLRRQLRRAKSLTAKPFGVNISLEIPEHKECMDIALEEGIKIMTTAAGSPKLYTKYLKQSEVVVMHTVFSVRHAKVAEAEGVDAVIASGCEAGGLISRDEVSTMVLIPQVVDAVKIPVIAAGGIADARGFVAALALGAEGVQMGTRFVATQECPVHQNFKQAIVKAIDTDTTITGRKSGIGARVLKNELARQLLAVEEGGTTAEEVQSLLGIGRLRLAVEGNVEEGSLMCGAVAGMITQIMSVAEVIHSLVDGHDKLVASL